jgi:hypothetical protein
MNKKTSAEHTTVPQMLKQSAATPAARPHNPIGLSPAQFVLLISHPESGCNAVQRVYLFYNILCLLSSKSENLFLNNL